MKLMKLTNRKCPGLGKTIYINPASIVCISQAEEGTYIDYPLAEDMYYHVTETVEEVARIWEEAMNDRQ
jgi:hypothetical protein